MKLSKKIYFWVRIFVIAILIVGAIYTFILSLIVVQGNSMMPTLKSNERILISKYNIDIDEINRFDIVVFRATEDKDYVKRVIGLPGDTIQYIDDVLYVNSKAVEEPYLDEYKQHISGNLTADFIFEGTVPENQLFVLGDNRRDSLDSRVIGTIPIDTVIGKVLDL